MEATTNPAAIVVVVYLMVIPVIGGWRLRMRSLEEFHLAGRSLRMILLTGTFYATIAGASSTIGMAGLGFSKGLPGAWWMLSGTIGMLVLTFFAGKIRSTGCYTLPQLVGSFYGERTRVTASVLITSLGIFSRSLYPKISPEQDIPALLTGLLSPGVEGLVAAALLAAFMSSADTSLMTATSIFFGQSYPLLGMPVSAIILFGVS